MLLSVNHHASAESTVWTAESTVWTAELIVWTAESTVWTAESVVSALLTQAVGRVGCWTD